MKKLLFSVAAFIAVLLAAEVGLTMLGQHGLTSALESGYGLPESLEVRLNSFPFLVSMAQNHLSELQFKWKGELAMDLGGNAEKVPYAGNVRLYDVKLDIRSALKGRLKLSGISRAYASIALDEAGVAAILGSEVGDVRIEDGRVRIGRGPKESKCRVKVVDGNTLSFEKTDGSTKGTGSGPESEPSIKECDFSDLPMGATFRVASISGNLLVIEVSIPEWEGFL